MTPTHAAMTFAIEVETLLRSIRVLRPDLDQAPICAWATAQAQASTEHGPLPYLELAYRAVLEDGPLPWLPPPSGLTAPLA